MGEAAFVNQTPNPASRHDRRGLRLTTAGFDYILAGATVFLVLFGLLMVYSASPVPSAQMNAHADYFVKRQILWVFVGVASVIFFMLFSYRWLKQLAVAMIVVTVALLILVQIIGVSTLGAERSFIGASVRPSELAKLVIIIYVAIWLDSKRDVLNNISLGLIPLGGILGVTGGLIFIQPDMSASITVVLLGILMFFLAGGAWRQIAVVGLAALFLGGIIVLFTNTGRARMGDYVAGLENLTHASDHISHAAQAIINGGLIGTGIGKGTMKSIGLPVAHTDSIFAVIAEETGLAGILLLLAGYLVIGWRGLNIARAAADPFGRLLAGGITFWILWEAFLNIGVMINLLPNAGNALPFISYGGSSMGTSLAGIGMLLAISQDTQQKSHEGANTFGSVVDLRWRDRRRRVPRAGRSAGAQDGL